MLSEQFGKLHLLGPEICADPLEDKILGHFAAGRKSAAHLGHGFGLAAERDLGIEQLVARGAIFAALIGEAHMLKAQMVHLTPPRSPILRGAQAPPRSAHIC